MATAEHREPCDSRGSCTVLGAPGGEIPPGDSSIAPNAARVLQQRMSVAARKRQLATKVRCVVKGHKETFALQQRASYSITSSAVASIVCETLRPSAFAVLRLITNSNLVGCSTGISPGFAPRRILSTKSAVRRNISGKFGP